MTFDEFVTKYMRERVDFDGAYGAQCVDLFRQYCKDVVRSPHTGAVVGAKDIYEKYNSLPVEMEWFSRLGARHAAAMGDVAVWGATKSNKYGHVAVVVSRVDPKTLLVFEQDGYRQDGARLSLRSTAGLLGYLVPKARAA